MMELCGETDRTAQGHATLGTVVLERYVELERERAARIHAVTAVAPGA